MSGLIGITRLAFGLQNLGDSVKMKRDTTIINEELDKLDELSDEMSENNETSSNDPNTGIKYLIHIGTPLNLTGNINFNNINNLVEIIARSGEPVLLEIERQMNPTKIQQNELFKLISSKEFRASLLAGSVKCIPYQKQLESINPIELSRFVYNEVSKLKDYNDKCNVLKPLLLDEYFKLAKISEDESIQNYYLSTLTGTFMSYVISNKLNNFDAFGPHSLGQYNNNLFLLINKEVDLQQSFFRLNSDIIHNKHHTHNSINHSNEQETLYAESSEKVKFDGNIDERVGSANTNEININNNPDFNNKPTSEATTSEATTSEATKADNKNNLPKIQGIFIGPFNNYEFIEYGNN